MPTPRSLPARTPIEAAYLRALQVVLAIELVVQDGTLPLDERDELHLLQYDATKLADRLERFVPRGGE